MTRRDIWQTAARQLRSGPDRDQRAEVLLGIHEMVGKDLDKLRDGKHFIRYTGRDPISDVAVDEIADQLEALEPGSVDALQALDHALHAAIPTRFRRK